MRVLICAFSNAHLTRTQIQAIKKFIPGSQIYVSLDRGFTQLGDLQIARDFRKVFSDEKVERITFQQNWHSRRRRFFPESENSRSLGPSHRHADVLQNGVHYLLKKSNSPILILDEDMIPFKEPEFLSSTEMHLAYVPQPRPLVNPKVHYPWPGIFYFWPERTQNNGLISWDLSNHQGIALDTGGAMLKWLELNLKESALISSLRTLTWDASKTNFDFTQLQDFLKLDRELGEGNQFCEIYDNSFLHLRASSNWIGIKQSIAVERLRLFLDGMNEIIRIS